MDYSEARKMIRKYAQADRKCQEAAWALHQARGSEKAAALTAYNEALDDWSTREDALLAILLRDPQDQACDECNAEPGEPCRDYCTAR